MTHLAMLLVGCTTNTMGHQRQSYGSQQQWSRLIFSTFPQEFFCYLYLSKIKIHVERMVGCMQSLPAPVDADFPQEF